MATDKKKTSNTTASLEKKNAGPTDDGVWAGDLPDGGRGGEEHDAGKQLGRKLPQSTGGAIPPGDGVREREDSGMRGKPAASDADEHAGGGNGGTTKSL